MLLCYIADVLIDKYMNYESLNRDTKHVTDVVRIEAQFESMSTEEVDILILDKVQNISIRWAQCRKSFRTLFMTFNRGNGHNMPQDRFDIRIGNEIIGDMPVETFVRVYRDRRTDAFITHPYTRVGAIESHEYTTERFDDTYHYRYGTHHSKSAKISINHDMPEPTIRLERVDGKLIMDMDISAKAVFVAGLTSHVDPLIERTEETLILLSSAAMDSELNPELAEKFKMGDSYHV